MRFVSYFVLLSLLILLPVNEMSAQSLTQPSGEVVAEAKAIAADSIFARLNPEQAETLAEWITDQVHSEVSGTSRTQQLNQFRSQLDMITQDSPESPFGEMVGYDLIQESYLPGTDKYFRLTYMTYHQEVPLIWEMHFYVKPDGNPQITWMQFDGQNPFVYMTTPDMLIEQYYNAF